MDYFITILLSLLALVAGLIILPKFLPNKDTQDTDEEEEE